jgi:small-conductance mechanosensitive channel
MMRRFFADMNPLVRGFLIIGLIALVVVLLNLQNTVSSLFLIASIAFPLAIAFFLYLIWRERRGEISVWPARVQFAFYGGAILIVIAILGYIFVRPSGLAALAFLLTIVLSAVAMWRAWKTQHTYGY